MRTLNLIMDLVCIITHLDRDDSNHTPEQPAVAVYQKHTISLRDEGRKL